MLGALKVAPKITSNGNTNGNVLFDLTFYNLVEWSFRVGCDVDEVS